MKTSGNPLSRRLLQQITCDCSDQQLAGISTGGWIALSLFIGMAMGSVATLLVQCCRRRRELRYIQQGNAARQSMVHMQALPAAPHTPCRQQAGSRQADPAAPSSLAASQSRNGESKYFSPLNTNKGHGSLAVVHQLSELRSSMHFSDNGGDTHSVAASDQHATKEKNSVTHGQQAVDQGSQSARDFSQHGMRLQQVVSQGQTTRPAAVVELLQSGLPLSTGKQGAPLVQGSHAVGTQLPQELSSSLLSADGPLNAEDSSPEPVNSVAAHVNPGVSSSQVARAIPGAVGCSDTSATAAAPAAPPRQQVELPGTSAQGPAAGIPAASALSPVGHSNDPGHAPSPVTVAEIEDEYEESDLDDDWKALLGGVDVRLKMQGARPMNARERAVAIKKLLVATGTRGVEFALNTTLQEVLNFRLVHGR